MSSSKSRLVEAPGRSSPFSVFLLIRSLAFGGAQRQLVHLAGGLCARGHRVTVGIFYLPGPLLPELERSGAAIVDLGKAGRWDMAGFALRLRRAIADSRSDLVYSFGGDANIVTGLLRPWIPPGRLVWSIRASQMELGQYSWAHRLASKMERRLSSIPDLIISNSAAGMRFAAANGFPQSRVEVIHNGIDTERFRPDVDLRRSQRRKWGLSDRDIAVGTLARLDPMKGHRHFLEAAGKLAAHRKELRFLCIGDGPEEERLKAFAGGLGLADRILFPGPADDPVMALNGLDIFCSASLWGEGFSNSIGEAMACGLRCVVSDVGDSAAIVGDCGIVVPPADADALARAILAAIEEAEDHSGDGRKRVIENFSVDRMVERTTAILKRAMGSDASLAPGQAAVVDDCGAAS